MTLHSGMVTTVLKPKAVIDPINKIQDVTDVPTKCNPGFLIVVSLLEIEGWKKV